MSKKRFGRLALAISALGLLISPFTSQALTPTFSVLYNFQPVVDSSQFVTLYDAQNHKKGEWNVGLYLDYAHQPLELASPVGVRQLGVVDGTIVANVLGSYGITDWFTVGARVPVVLFNNYEGLPNTPARALAEHDFSMGDVGLDLKFRLLSAKEGRIGLAVIPFLHFPTGRSTTFVGDGQVNGGAKVAFHADVHERVRLVANVGYLIKKGVVIRGLDADDQFQIGVGANVKIIKDKLDLIAEGHTETVAKDFFSNKIQTPAEVGGALRYHATKNLDFTAGGTAGLNHGYGSPDYRVFLGVNYTRHREDAPEPVVSKKDIIIKEKIQFDFDKSTIKSESFGILDNVVQILKENSDFKMVRIEGHTDSVGSDAYNQRLSQRRAEAVRQYLINKGIPASKLQAVGKGESEPLADNSTSAGRAKNRRTEFHVEN